MILCLTIYAGSLTEFLYEKTGDSRTCRKLDRYGMRFSRRFFGIGIRILQRISETSVSALASISMDIQIDQCPIGGQNQLGLLEGYKNPIPYATCL